MQAASAHRGAAFYLNEPAGVRYKNHESAALVVLIDIVRGSRVLLAYSSPCRNLKMQNTLSCPGRPLRYFGALSDPKMQYGVGMLGGESFLSTAKLLENHVHTVAP